MAERDDVTVLAGPPHYPEWRIHDGYGGWRRAVVEDGVDVVRLRHVVPRHTSTAARLAHETTFAARVLTQRLARPDVVLAVSPPLFGAWAAMRLARRWRVPFGLVVQDIYSEGVRELADGRPSAGAASATAIESAVVTRADGVLTIHDRFAATLERLGRPRDRTTVVGNWSHVPEPSRARSAIRAGLGWTTETVVLHAGNMGAKQGLETVVEAARLADRQALPLRFVLLGDGNQRRRLEELAAGIERIRFLPPAGQVEYADIMHAADVLLVCERPGVAEMSLPSKITSYCAAGRPIVAATGASGATAASLRGSGAGLLVPAGDPAKLVETLVELTTQPEHAAELGRRGRRHADIHHGPLSALTGYDAWLDQLLELRAVVT